MNPDIRSQTKEQLEALFGEWGEPAYRVSQVLAWLYRQRVTDWEAMTNLPKRLRDKLQAHFSLQSLELVRQQGSRDSTRKFLWRLSDRSLIESVLIPASPALYGEASDRQTLCVSTQVGCAYGCKFCASGLEGWKRHLRPDEIVEQVLAIERVSSSEFRVSSSQPVASPQPEIRNSEPETANPQPEPRKPKVPARLVDHLVIMGMGEPLANYETLLQALRIRNAPWGGGIGARKITVSTSGLAPQIRRLADEPLRCRLAVSLHGATDETRNRIMPVNRKFPLRELTDACVYYQEKKGRMITLEYILIAGVNDHAAAVRPLAALARKLRTSNAMWLSSMCCDSWPSGTPTRPTP